MLLLSPPSRGCRGPPCLESLPLAAGPHRRGRGRGAQEHALIFPDLLLLLQILTTAFPSSSLKVSSELSILTR